MDVEIITTMVSLVLQAAERISNILRKQKMQGEATPELEEAVAKLLDSIAALGELPAYLLDLKDLHHYTTGFRSSLAEIEAGIKEDIQKAGFGDANVQLRNMNAPAMPLSDLRQHCEDSGILEMDDRLHREYKKLSEGLKDVGSLI